MAIHDSTRQILTAARKLHQMAQDERKDDFLEGMTKELVKSAERILAREIALPLVVRREEIDGR